MQNTSQITIFGAILKTGEQCYNVCAWLCVHGCVCMAVCAWLCVHVMGQVHSNPCLFFLQVCCYRHGDYGHGSVVQVWPAWYVRATNTGRY